MPLFIAVLRKNKCLVTRLSHVRKAGSHVTPNTYYMDHIKRWILSSLPYYILLDIMIAITTHHAFLVEYHSEIAANEMPSSSLVSL